jgi:hypothetical protein
MGLAVLLVLVLLTPFRQKVALKGPIDRSRLFEI